MAPCQPDGSVRVISPLKLSASNTLVPEVKQLQSQTPKHLPWDDLPEAAQFQQLAPSRKRLLDTVKMIAYRAETAMVGILRENLSRADDGRSLIQELFRQDADIKLDEAHQRLEVHVHPLANPRSNRAVAHLGASHHRGNDLPRHQAHARLLPPQPQSLKQGSSIFRPSQES
jgi:hypothetical protein